MEETIISLLYYGEPQQAHDIYLFDGQGSYKDEIAPLTVLRVTDAVLAD